MNYTSAIEFIINNRKSALTEGDLLYKDALLSNPKLSALDKQYRYFVINGNEEESIDTKKAVDKILKDMKIYDKVYPKPHCKICNDSAYFNGKICACVKRLALSANKPTIPLHSFAESDPSLFTNSALYTKTQNVLATFCEKFPNTKFKNIILCGNAGTGKTFLASCMADAIMSKGYSVVFVTAFEANEMMLRYHTTFDANKAESLRPLLDADFLIIDDLGTESVYKNVTKEYFFHIINERQIDKKPTMITTNLTLDQIAIRYGERTCSRLLDKKICYSIEFDFNDTRKLKIND